MAERDYQLTVQKKAIRRIHIYVYPSQNCVRVTAPKDISDAKIAEFLREKEAWIQKHLRSAAQKEAGVTDTTVLLFGKRYPLAIRHAPGRAKVVRDSERVVVHCPQGTSPEKIGKLIKNWLKTCLEEKIRSLASDCERRTGLHAKEWRVRDMHTRWGSCSIQQRRIRIALMLVHKREALIEYVMVHDLIHLKEAGHNAAFYDYFQKVMPDFQKRRAELNGR